MTNTSSIKNEESSHKVSVISTAFIQINTPGGNTLIYVKFN